MRRIHTPHVIKVNKALKMAMAADDRRDYEIANAARVRPDELSGFKSGRLVPSPEKQQRIADVLGVPVGELFDTDSEALAS